MLHIRNKNTFKYFKLNKHIIAYFSGISDIDGTKFPKPKKLKKTSKKDAILVKNLILNEDILFNEDEIDYETNEDYDNYDDFKDEEVVVNPKKARNKKTSIKKNKMSNKTELKIKKLANMSKKTKVAKVKIPAVTSEIVQVIDYDKTDQYNHYKVKCYNPRIDYKDLSKQEQDAQCEKNDEMFELTHVLFKHTEKDVKLHPFICVDPKLKKNNSHENGVIREPDSIEEILIALKKLKKDNPEFIYYYHRTPKGRIIELDLERYFNTLLDPDSPEKEAAAALRGYVMRYQFKETVIKDKQLGTTKRNKKFNTFSTQLAQTMLTNVEKLCNLKRSTKK